MRLLVAAAITASTCSGKSSCAKLVPREVAEKHLSGYRFTEEILRGGTGCHYETSQSHVAIWFDCEQDALRAVTTEIDIMKRNGGHEVRGIGLAAFLESEGRVRFWIEHPA